MVWKDKNDYWVYFGTGSILSTQDRGEKSKVLQYAIELRDNNNKIKRVDQLLENNLSRKNIIDGVRTLSIEKSPDSSATNASNGWYIPLQMKDDKDLTGERIISTSSITNNNEIVFVTWGLHEYSYDNEAYAQAMCIADTPHSKLLVLKSKTGLSASLRYGESTAGIEVIDEFLGTPSGPHVTLDSGLSGEKRDTNKAERRS